MFGKKFFSTDTAFAASDSPSNANASRFPAIIFTLLPLLFALRYLDAQPSTRTYGPTHWFLSYDHGFLRRALIGEFFTHFAFISWRSIQLVEIALLLVLSLLTYLVFRPLLFGSINERRLAAFLFTAPAFLPHMAYLGGEMDNFLYIAILLGAFFLIRLGNNLGLLLATAFTILGLVLHEAFLLMFYPLLLALIIDLLHRQRIKPVAAALHLGVVLAVFLAIVHFGKLSGTPPEWIARAELRTNMPIEGAVFVALHNTFSEQIRFVLRLYTPKLLAGIILTLLLSIPYGVVLFRLLLTTMRLRGYSVARSRIVLLLFFLPMTLIPVGHDVMRWTSALCMDVSLYILFLYQVSPATPRDGETDLRSPITAWTSAPMYAATLLYIVVLGPWGIAGNRFLSNLGDLLKR